MIFIGLELLGLSLYVMTAFDKTDRAFGGSWPEIFPVRQHLQRFHTFRNQFDLRNVGHDQSCGDFAETGDRIDPTAAGRWDCDDAHRLRLQNCRGTISPLGARCVSGRARPQLSVYCVSL